MWRENGISLSVAKQGSTVFAGLKIGCPHESENEVESENHPKCYIYEQKWKIFAGVAKSSLTFFVFKVVSSEFQGI